MYQNECFFIYHDGRDSTHDLTEKDLAHGFRSRNNLFSLPYVGRKNIIPSVKSMYAFFFFFKTPISEFLTSDSDYERDHLAKPVLNDLVDTLHAIMVDKKNEGKECTKKHQ